MEQRGKAGQQIQPCQHHVNGQTAVQTLADLLKLLAQILYQCLTAGFIRRQQIGKIERQDKTVERLASARLHQPAQPVFAQAAAEQIIPAGSGQYAVNIENYRLVAHSRCDQRVVFHTPDAFRRVNNVRRKALAQQRAFAATRRTNDHIPRQLPQITAVIQMAAQAQQPVIQILLLAVEFHGQRIFFFLPLLFLLFFQLLQTLHHPPGEPDQSDKSPDGGRQPAVCQRSQPVLLIERPFWTLPPDPHQQKNPCQRQ